MVYETAMPLQWVEHPAVLKFFRTIRPSFKLPSRFLLSNTLLFDTYHSLKEKINKKLGHFKWLCLGWDGWSRTAGSEHLLNFHASAFGISAFIDSRTIHQESVTSEFTVSCVDDVMTRHGLEKRVSAVVTDSPKVNVNARGLLSEKYPGLIVLGCLAHALNLVIRDLIHKPKICPLFAKLLSRCRRIVKLFKRQSSLNAILAPAQKNHGVTRKLSLEVVTRWASGVRMMESVMANR